MARRNKEIKYNSNPRGLEEPSEKSFSTNMSSKGRNRENRKGANKADDSFLPSVSNTASDRQKVMMAGLAPIRSLI